MHHPACPFYKIGSSSSRPQIPGPITDNWSLPAVSMPLTTPHVLKTTELHPVAFMLELTLLTNTKTTRNGRYLSLAVSHERSHPHGCPLHRHSTVGSSRTITTLTNLCQGPKIFGYVDHKGRPLVAFVIASAFGFIDLLKRGSNELPRLCVHTTSNDISMSRPKARIPSPFLTSTVLKFGVVPDQRHPQLQWYVYEARQNSEIDHLD